MSRENPILDIQNLQAFFHTRRGIVRAVNDLSFKLHKGEISVKNNENKGSIFTIKF